MMRRTPLTRTKPLRRVAMKQGPSAKARARSERMAKAREVVLVRSGGRCEYWERGDADERCTSDGTDLHHITRRSQGGNEDVDNLVLLCRHHHSDVIHAHPERAYREGYLRRSS